MAGEAGVGEGGQAAAAAISTARTEKTVTPQTPEAPKNAFEIPQEKLQIGVDATGKKRANELVDIVKGGKDIPNTLDEFSKGGVIEDEVPPPSDKNVEAFKQYQQTMRTETPTGADTNNPQNLIDQTDNSPTPTKNEAAFANYRDTMRTEQPDDSDIPKGKEMTGAEILDQMNKDADARRTHENWKKIYDDVDTDKPAVNKNQTSSSEPEDGAKADQAQTTEKNGPGETKTQNDQKPEPEEDNSFTTPGGHESNMQNMKGDENKKPDEKDSNENTDEKSKKQKEQIDKITNQLKELKPDFDPANPEGKDLLKKLTENPDMMEKFSERLQIQREVNKNLEDTANNLGIDSSKLKDFVTNETINRDIGQLEEQIKKSTDEQGDNPDPQKQKELKEKKDEMTLLQALLIILLAGVKGATEAAYTEAQGNKR